MSEQDKDQLPQALPGEADALDHAGEFAARVADETPAEFTGLMASPTVQALLSGENALNPGKVYAWAEYRVFRREFRQRFPGAGKKACINAFCRLFLKNDISMSNLVRALEADQGEDLARLEQRRGGEKKPAG